MDEETNVLKTKFDDFSSRLDAKTHEFKATGELQNEHMIASLRKRQRAMKAKLDDAIRSGIVTKVLKLEVERDFESLLGEFSRIEKEFDAAAIREVQTNRN